MINKVSFGLFKKRLRRYYHPREALLFISVII